MRVSNRLFRRGADTHCQCFYSPFLLFLLTQAQVFTNSSTTSDSSTSSSESSESFSISWSHPPKLCTFTARKLPRPYIASLLVRFGPVTKFEAIIAVVASSSRMSGPFSWMVSNFACLADMRLNNKPGANLVPLYQAHEAAAIQSPSRAPKASYG